MLFGSSLSASAQESGKQEALDNFNQATAEDKAIREKLAEVNEVVAATNARLGRVNDRIAAAEKVMSESASELQDIETQMADVSASLEVSAIETFKTRGLELPFFLNLGNSDEDKADRHERQLSERINKSTAESLTLLRDLEKARQDAAVAAETAKAGAEADAAEIKVISAELEVQVTEQKKLQAEAQKRVGKWGAELKAYEAEDEAIQGLIAANEAAIERYEDSLENPLRSDRVSALGFQWPLAAGRISSEYGYRIHPVYGSRRLHAGIDIAQGNGTPIGASASGKVISAATRGGYGRTVLIDHGGGITTLYAHMNSYGEGIQSGAQVGRGAVIGTVGSTGTSTGNHLHFEVRVNGTATNPRPYLPSR